MAKLLDYPEVVKILDDLFDKLLSESGRGAVIIGAAAVEEHLEKFIEDILPKDTNKYKKRLLNYPGALSSFSAKIELAFAFRLISEKLYNSLNSLRELRNKAAHNSEHFTLSEHREKLDKIFDIGPSMPLHIRNDSMKAMINLKFHSLNHHFDEMKLTDSEKKEQIENIIENKELMTKLELQVPHWELIYGLSLICGIITFTKNNTLELLNPIKTWSNLKG